MKWVIDSLLLIALPVAYYLIELQSAKQPSVGLIAIIIFLGIINLYKDIQDDRQSNRIEKNTDETLNRLRSFEDVLKKNPPAVIEPNKTSWSVSQILTGMQPDTLVMLGVILKYKPSNHLELIRLIKPFKFSPNQYNEAFRRLIFTGLVFVGNPADTKQSSPLYAPISTVRNEEMYKWFKDNWEVLFKNYLDIEPSFESIRKN